MDKLNKLRGKDQRYFKRLDTLAKKYGIHIFVIEKR